MGHCKRFHEGMDFCLHNSTKHRKGVADDFVFHPRVRDAPFALAFLWENATRESGRPKAANPMLANRVVEEAFKQVKLGHVMNLLLECNDIEHAFLVNWWCDLVGQEKWCPHVSLQTLSSYLKLEKDDTKGQDVDASSRDSEAEHDYETFAYLEQQVAHLEQKHMESDLQGENESAPSKTAEHQLPKIMVSGIDPGETMMLTVHGEYQDSHSTFGEGVSSSVVKDGDYNDRGCGVWNLMPAPGSSKVTFEGNAVPVAVIADEEGGSTVEMAELDPRWHGPRNCGPAGLVEALPNDA